MNESENYPYFTVRTATGSVLTFDDKDIHLKCSFLVPRTTLVSLSSSIYSVPEIGKTKEENRYLLHIIVPFGSLFGTTLSFSFNSVPEMGKTYEKIMIRMCLCC
jgi:hypothetical protein